MSGPHLTIAMYTEGLPFAGDTLDRRALGGSETAFICVARELATLGHHVTAYCLCEQEGTYDGVAYRNIARADPGRIGCPDLFLCSRFFDVLARGAQGRVRALWMHDVLVPQMAAGLRLFLPRIDVVYCVSEYHRALSLHALRELGPKVRTTFNGVDLGLADEAIARVPQKRHQIMYSSRPERGLLRALDLYERIGDTRLELLVCSYASVPDPAIRDLEARCAARIAELHRRGYPIRTGSFPRAELYRHLAESKAVIYPTDYPEVFCISAVEAQACGTVFLTTDDFALRETVGYERLPAGDDAAFLARMSEVLARPELRADLERRGRWHVRAFTWRRVAQRFVDDARSLGASPGRPMPTPIGFFDRIGPPTRFAAPSLPDHRADGDPPTGIEVPAITYPAREAEIRILQRYRRSREDAIPVGEIPAPAGRSLPMISCLTVTAPGRSRLLKRAIQCFCDQTYPRRELIVVSDADGRSRRAIESTLDWFGRDDIRFVPVEPGGLTLGSLRNISMESASGEVLCQWDDDDIYHPLRLEIQSAALLQRDAAACLLTDQLQYFASMNALYWIDWTSGGLTGGPWQYIPGSIMMSRGIDLRYPEEGPSARKGEDFAFLEELTRRAPVTGLRGHGYVYVYVYHGFNTYSFDHHFGQTVRVAPPGFILERAALLRRALRYYPLPRPITVYSKDEPVLEFAD